MWFHEADKKQPRMDQTTLVRALAVKSPCDFMWLLGAGASVTSGIKSASQCIWAWKLQLFLTAHPSVAPDLFADTTDRGVQDRIQHWIDSVPGSSPRGDPAEYAYFIERCYPKAEDRRRYFEAIVRDGRPGPGYDLLGRMIALGHFRWFWTTNFDDMLARAIPRDCSRPVRQYGMDTTARLRSAAERDEYVNLVHLHGDYRYDSLRNTSEELQTLDQEYADELARLLVEVPLLVIGYGGSDESVIAALEAAYSRRGRGTLYWLVLNGSEPNDRVRALVGTAQQHGHDAALVGIDGFDDFVRRAAQLLLPAEEVARLVEEERKTAEQAHPSFRHESYPGQVGVAKSNTWSLTLPSSYWSCPAPHIGSWKELREQLGDAPVAAGLLGGRIVALGPPGEVARLGRVSESAVARVDFTAADLQSDTVLHSVVRDYVVRALAGDGWTIGRQRGCFLLYRSADARPVQGFPDFRWCRAAEIDLHFHAGTPVLTVVPDRYVFCDDSSGRVPPAAQGVVNRELARQWNPQFNDELNKWREALGLKAQDVPVGLGVGPGTSVVVIKRGPRFAKLLSPNPNAKISLGPSSALAELEAFNLQEPTLRFGDGLDAHPLRGLLEKGPAELRLPSLPESNLRLGVVAPNGMHRGVEEVLHELEDGHQQVETKDEYQFPYPGFESAFRVRLRVGTSAGGRVAFPVELSAGSAVAQQREALERVCACIDRAVTASASVVLIVFPDVWEHIEEVEDGEQRFDFHDLVKAYAAPRGIRTQLFRESTPRKRQRLEVLWWLALAVYAKSNRVPWTLESAMSGTVHVGIGYGLDLADRSRPIVMCCSHIYQSSGLGLRFQLSEIGEPAFVRRCNPYLTRDDAYRVGTKALQVVIEASERPPKRVCISKRTPFTNDELTGFLAALKQIPEVELLSAEMDDGIRLIRAKPSGSEPESFPVPRGSVVPYGDHEALVWVHGDVAGISSKFGGAHYYQGKSRIPAPLRITRYAGSASLEELAADLLGLSKMDWNSFDLYGKIPVQLTSPARIARVAKLLGEVRLEDRDYRLFM